MNDVKKQFDERTEPNCDAVDCGERGIRCNGQTIRQLMYDSTETDGNKETMMDYIISWTLRHAADEFKEEAPILWEYCRAIFGKLVGEDLKKDTTLSEICVYKQEEDIDLWVEFVLNNENHAIL